MKKIISSILLAVSASSNLLLAQVENKLEETSLLESASAPIFYLPSSISYLGVTPKLMMDPAELKNIQEGIEDLKGVVGSPGKAPISTTAFAHSPCSSSAAMSGKVGSEAGAALTHDEAAEENSTNTFLEDEICNNIYTSCLAKVAAMSQSRSLIAGGNAEAALQEAKEWDAAEKKAKRDVDKSKRALDKARKEKEAAEKKLDSSKASIHGKAYADEAYYNFQVKELAEELADARVVTAEATLMAIEVRGTAQSAGAEADLAEAREEERAACEALEKATRNSSIASSEDAHSPFSSPNNRKKISSPESSSPLPFTPPRPPGSGLKSVEPEQIFASPSIPAATAVELSPSNVTFVEPLSSLKLSEDSAAQQRKEGAASKEKSVATFEAEFSEMIESAKTQAEETVATATAARENAEKIGTSAKEWNKAIEEAEIAEEAYAHLGGLYKTYQEQAAEHYSGAMLNTKRSKYNIELKKAETKKRSWTTEIEECREKKESLKKEKGAGEKAEPTAREKEQAEITKWKAAAEEAQQKETTATAAGKKEESSQWRGVKSALLGAIEQKRKAIEAEVSGKKELATSWNDIAQQNIQASEFFTKAATAYATRKTTEGQSWYNAGLSSSSVAEKNGKLL
ncbi:MAG: hypothetical protein A3F67_04430 [Verrucomicrobia bacterium RIFCSPHIGHO2_12_FULL_41_10]|nr:MAG: hypothetical protein A3F67_04430 [Verrucomicrobia bacterium RIFCSPHIGHO2_12_FULL_41_10]HLB34334.1 hypothetical protein [Chthoniobacterales bacterium]